MAANLACELEGSHLIRHESALHRGSSRRVEVETERSELYFVLDQTVVHQDDLRWYPKTRQLAKRESSS